MTRHIGDFKYMNLTQWAEDRANGIQYETPYGKVTVDSQEIRMGKTYSGALNKGQRPRPGSMLYEKLGCIHQEEVVHSRPWSSNKRPFWQISSYKTVRNEQTSTPSNK